ncbi:hypothetical protein G9A89_019008 [Geosiphon pyriformis]|nr:hypothetical protein G9A89_019008 [Geosiphon pyriformis]
MEEKCLVEKTSFDYDEGGVFIEEDPNQMLKRPSTKTKKALGKLLRKIDFSGHNDIDDVLLDGLLELSSSLKNLVNVSIKKLFVLNIELNKMVGKTSLDKCAIVRKLFSRINGFKEVSTPSKFLGIIRATFIFKLSLIKAIKKTTGVRIMVNINLKKSTGHSDQAVVLKKISIGTSVKTMHTAVFKFKVIKSIKMQLLWLWQKAIVKFEEQHQTNLLAAKWSIFIKKDAICVVKADLDKQMWDLRDYYRVLFYTLFVRTNTHNIWNFIGSVDGKMCIINCYPIIYVRTKCAIVCFTSIESLKTVIKTTSVLRDVNLHWFYLGVTKCAKYKKVGHTLLNCSLDEKISSSQLSHRVLSEENKSRLTSIYAKCSALIAHPVLFDSVFWANIVGESSFPSLFFTK